MSNRIYSVIENKKRELDSRIFFALGMNEKNYSVGFGKKQNFEHIHMVPEVISPAPPVAT